MPATRIALAAQANQTLVADQHQKPIDQKYDSHPHAQASEGVGRIMPTQGHDSSADRCNNYSTCHCHKGLGYPRHEQEGSGGERSHGGHCS